MTPAEKTGGGRKERWSCATNNKQFILSFCRNGHQEFHFPGRMDSAESRREECAGKKSGKKAGGSFSGSGKGKMEERKEGSALSQTKAVLLFSPVFCHCFLFLPESVLWRGNLRM